MERRQATSGSAPVAGREGSWYWVRRIRSWVVRGYWPRASRSAVKAQDPSQEGPTDELLRRFEAGRDLALQQALIVEALDLLDDQDARAIRSRLGQDPAGAESRASTGAGIDDASRYALAMTRFSTRLAWVVAREAQGVAPTERRALGRVRFFGDSAQMVAERLRLPQEVVSRWVRDGNLSTVSI